MKNLLLLFVISFISTLVNAQDIPAKANTIIITLADTNNINEKIMEVLASKDYTIKSVDKKTSLIITGPKTLKNNTRLNLNVKVNGADIMLSGMILIASQGSLPIEFKGAKGTPIMNAWDEMAKVAKVFGGKMKYEIK